MMKRAVILVNPYLDTQAEFYQPRRVAEELERLGVRTDILPNVGLISVEEGMARETLAEKYDFCVYLDKDRYVPRVLEKRGMRLFNRAEAVELCDDKMLTHIALSDRGIPMPKTVPAPLCYKESARPAGETFGLEFPVVVKECFGSLGKQVYLAENADALADIRERLKLRPHLLQEFIAESAGRDVRAVVIGGRIAAAMKRSSNGDFRSNLGRGGKGEAYPVGEIRALAEKTAEILRLDYCGIDLLLSNRGYLVCEVNSNAFFGGIESVTGVNIARLYAEYMVKKVY